MDWFAFDPGVPRTIWTLNLHRPVVHEYRPGGTVITHVRPSGEKSAIMNQLIDQFRGREILSNGPRKIPNKRF